MYEYKCKIVKVIDGDTVDVDIDLGFGIWSANYEDEIRASRSESSREGLNQ